MAYQARVSTLEQLLRQAGDVQDLLIQQVPTHLHCSDGRSIMLISLYGLAYDRRQPSRALVFTWAPPADSRLWQSLQRFPYAGIACIEMLLQSEPCGWTTCARVTDRLSLLRCHWLTRTGLVPVAHA